MKKRRTYKRQALTLLFIVIGILIVLNIFSSAFFTRLDLTVGIGMSFTEPFESEVNQINKHFPNRSPQEVKQAIAQVKESFHGSRGRNRFQLIAELLNQQ